MVIPGEQALAERGLRLTPQRMMILEAIEARDDHFSAEEIYAQVRQRYSHMNLSTVYRTLEILEQAGLVTQTDLGDGRVRYHWTEKSRHHHLICQGCGQVIDLEECLLAPLKETLRRDYGFSANIAHVTIFGRCAKCHEV
ncbi:MAG: transcriptional repressor [Bacteroidetes bacterium]|nr:transcriptional repressor [Bacteroidota bacterium]MCL5026900.1 transcriptional repressor [Chloroflexota bacterium]